MNVIYVTFSVINGYFNKFVILKYRKVEFLDARDSSTTEGMLQSISFWTKVNILNLVKKKKLFSKIISKNIYNKIG